MGKNKQVCEEPLIKNFFENSWNEHLLSRKHHHNDVEAAAELDQRFAEFYLKKRLVSYTNKLTHFYSKDFDRKRRVQLEQLQLDKPHQEDKPNDFISAIPATSQDVVDIFSREMFDILPTELMKETFRSLSTEKKMILHKFIFQQLSNKEIAKDLSCSPQNVSKLKLKALKSLRGVENNERNCECR